MLFSKQILVLVIVLRDSSWLPSQARPLLIVPDPQAHCGRYRPRADACTPGLVVGPGSAKGRSLGAWILLSI